MPHSHNTLILAYQFIQCGMNSTKWLSGHATTSSLLCLCLFCACKQGRVEVFLHIFLICYTTHPLKLAQDNLSIFFLPFTLVYPTPPPVSKNCTHLFRVAGKHLCGNYLQQAMVTHTEIQLVFISAGFPQPVLVYNTIQLPILNQLLLPVIIL